MLGLLSFVILQYTLVVVVFLWQWLLLKVGLSYSEYYQVVPVAYKVFQHVASYSLDLYFTLGAKSSFHFNDPYMKALPFKLF